MFQMPWWMRKGRVKLNSGIHLSHPILGDIESVFML